MGVCPRQSVFALDDIMSNNHKSDLSAAADALRIPLWGRVLIGFLVAEAVLLFGLIWTMHGDISEIRGTLKSLPVSVAQDLLSQANEDASAKNVPRALQAIGSAQSLLIRSKVKGVPASDENFQQLVADLNLLSRSSSAAIADKASGTRIVLADYRSALEPRPRMPGEQVKVEKPHSITVEAATIDKSTFPGSVFVAAPTAQPFNFFETPFFRRLANAPHMVSVGFMFGMQELDGFHWDGVAFENTLIRYEGGELELNNTRFINCTFELSDNPRSAKVATYVTLEQPYLKIGPGD